MKKYAVGMFIYSGDTTFFMYSKDNIYNSIQDAQRVMDFENDNYPTDNLRPFVIKEIDV